MPQVAVQGRDGIDLRSIYDIRMRFDDNCTSCYFPDEGLGSQAPENEGPGAVNGAMHFSQPRHQRNVHPGRLCRLESRA